MEDLRALAKKLENPGQEKLYLAARKRQIPVTRNQIKQFLSTRGEKQIFRPLPQSTGQTGTEGLGERWQMDLIQFTTAPSKVGRQTYRWILVLIEIFSRQIWAQPITD